MILTLISSIIYGLCFLCNVAIAYNFFISKDGELRIMMIHKFLGSALFFVCASLICAQFNAVFLKWSSLFLLYYLYYNLKLVIRLPKIVSDGGKNNAG